MTIDQWIKILEKASLKEVLDIMFTLSEYLYHRGDEYPRACIKESCKRWDISYDLPTPSAGVLITMSPGSNIILDMAGESQGIYTLFQVGYQRCKKLKSEEYTDAQNVYDNYLCLVHGYNPKDTYDNPRELNYIV